MICISCGKFYKIKSIRENPVVCSECVSRHIIRSTASPGFVRIPIIEDVESFVDNVKLKKGDRKLLLRHLDNDTLRDLHTDILKEWGRRK